MSKIKKISIVLVALVLIFPAAAGAACITSPISGIRICIGGAGVLSNISGLGLPSGSIYGIIENLVFWLLGMFAFFGIIGFVVSGIMYLVSAGDDEMITKAKKYMMYSIVGVIVGLAGYVLIQAVFWMLGGTDTQF